MTYDEVRSQIQTGDLIAVKKKSGFLPIATRWVTRSPYTHTGIAIWAGGRLLLAQTNAGGCGLIPLSQEQPYDFDIFACPVDKEVIETVIWDMLGERIPYGFFDLVRIFGWLMLKIPLPKQDGEDLVCSALSAMMYKKAGWNPKDLPSIPWPGAVVKELSSAKKFEVNSR